MTTVILILAAIGLAGFVAKVVILIRTRHEQTAYNLRIQRKVKRHIPDPEYEVPFFLEPGRGWVHK